MRDNPGEASTSESTGESPESSVGGITWCTARVKSLWRDLSWSEASGSLGDLGTFLPLLVGLTVESGVDVGTTLIVTGLYNLVTAMAFDVPMPVQPMKTIAAVALSDASLSIEQIVAAGMFVSTVVFFLGTTGMIDTFNGIVPKAVVHGMQIGLGVLLCVKAFTMAMFEDDEDYAVRTFLGADGLLLGLCALLIAAIELMRRLAKNSVRCDDDEESDDESVSGINLVDREERGEGTSTLTVDTKSLEKIPASKTKKQKSSFAAPPTALLLVILGIVISATRPGSLNSLKIGPTVPSLITFTAGDFKNGILKAGLPQLPLTTLNSIVAVCALSKDLFPDRPASPKLVATSVGAMNLVGAAIGVMPCCHGAGGLAAHYHFGARRGAATAFLGLCKLLLGFVFGGSLLTLLREFPKTVLGVMLGAASVELIRAAVGAFLGGRGKRGGDGGGGEREGDDARSTTGVSPLSTPNTTYIPLWREPDTYALLATAVATAASGNTGIGVGVGLVIAAATRTATEGFGKRFQNGNATGTENETSRV